MPGTTNREKPVYRASKSWDYVSSDSLASSENQTSIEERHSGETDEKTQSPNPAARPSVDHNPGSPNTLNSFENLMAALGEEQPDIQGLRHEEKKREWDEGRLPWTLYAIIVSLLGAVLPLKEAFQGKWLGDYVITAYYIYLFAVSFVFLLGLEIYLVLSAREESNSDNTKTLSTTQTNLSDPKDGGGVSNLGYEDDVSQDSEPGKITIMHRRELSRSASRDADDLFYIQTKDWSPVHAPNYRTSLYLRIAVIVLGLATMVYEGLIIKEFQELSANPACTIDFLFWPHCVYLAFLLVQTYFLFKHPQIEVSSKRCLIRFGCMHVFATNWCMGFRTFVRQIVTYYEVTENGTDASVTTTVAPGICEPADDILSKAAPYLYPCVFEYCLLAGAIVYGMFTHNLRIPQEDELYGAAPQDRQAQLQEINCHHTHRGLFFGIVVMAGTCTSIILFFSYLYEDEETSLLIYQVSDIALHFIVLFLIIVSWVQMKKLTYSPDPDGFDIASVILLVTMSSILLLCLFRVMAVVEDMVDGNRSLENMLCICSSLLNILVALAQSCFVMESLCRYTFTDEQYDNKYGRGCITFLIITNISLWFFKAFQMKSLELEARVHEDSYGHLPWKVIINASVPALIFYYLHCSACLATVWGQAYRHADRIPVTKSRLTSTHSVLASPVKYLHAGEVRLRGASRKLNMNNIPEDNIVSPISDV